MKSKSKNLSLTLLSPLGWLTIYFMIWLSPFAKDGENEYLSGYGLINSLLYSVLLLLLVVLALVIFSFWSLLIIYEGKGRIGEIKAYSFLFLVSLALVVLADGLFTTADFGVTFTWGYYLALGWLVSVGIIQVILSCIYVSKAKNSK